MEGNQMKMREALEEARDALDTIMSTSCHNLQEITASRAYRKCREALALPHRQCDVGTAEEQKDRFKHYCESVCDGIRCDHRLFREDDYDECIFAWAQMPYAHEGGAAQ